LFAHAAFHLLGQEGYRRLIETNIESARTLAAMVSASEAFELLCEPITNLVVYRHVPERFRADCRSGRLSPAANARVNGHNVALQQRQHASGSSYVSRTILTHLPRYPGIPTVALRAVLVNPEVRETDLAAVLDDQLQIAATLEMAAGSREPAESLQDD